MDIETTPQACLNEWDIRVWLLGSSESPFLRAEGQRHLSLCRECRLRMESILDSAMGRVCLTMDPEDWEAFVGYRLNNRTAQCVAGELEISVARVVIASSKILLAIRSQVKPQGSA